MSSWHDSPFTGIFTRFGPVDPRPHDPDVALVSGTIPPWGARREALAVGGAGWERAEAEGACVGEGVERLQPYRLPGDGTIESSVERWALDEPPVEPERWVLFHREQYAQPGFPFEPFTRRTRVRWACFREAATGLARWAPEEMAFLFLPPGERHRLCPSISTGLSSGRPGMPVLLRGVQEAVERDASVGAWWGRYPLEEWDGEAALRRLGPERRRRLERPNLRTRFFRVDTPLSAHVTWVTLEGEDLEGFTFSIGSACRETREESWAKSILEAVHGRRYAGILRDRRGGPPADFADHAAYYSLHPGRLRETALARAKQGRGGGGAREPLGALLERLGPGRPALFRILTPPGLAGEWLVLRVLVPGLQPLHGNHALAHLGGPLWAPRGLREYVSMPPHPFP